MRKIALGLLAAFVLSGCGGGSDELPEAQVAAAVVRPPLVISTYGDSTNFGYAPPLRDLYPPDAVALVELRALLNRSDIEIYTDSRPATNATQMLEGTDGSGMPWAKRLAADPAQIIVINHALNDRDPIEYRATLEQLVAGAKAAGKKVMLETPNPVRATPFAISRGLTQETLSERTVIMRDVALRTGAALCEQHAVIQNLGRTTADDLPDGIHPSDTLYRLKGRLRAQCLVTLLNP